VVARAHDRRHGFSGVTQTRFLARPLNLSTRNA
jgi:hypothetical protein